MEAEVEVEVHLLVPRMEGQSWAAAWNSWAASRWSRYCRPTPRGVNLARCRCRCRCTC